MSDENLPEGWEKRTSRSTGICSCKTINPDQNCPVYPFGGYVSVNSSAFACVEWIYEFTLCTCLVPSRAKLLWLCCAVCLLPVLLNNSVNDRRWFLSLATFHSRHKDSVFQFFDFSVSLGHSYYLNIYTKESQWETPTSPAEGGSNSGPNKVQCSHLLVKHAGSRRPSSWREENITRSKEKAIEILKGMLLLLYICFITSLPLGEKGGYQL